MKAQTRLFSLFFAGIGLAALLSGCGFTPLYGTAGGRDIPAEMAKVKIMPIADRAGQILRNGLIDKMTPRGQPTGPKYRLLVILKIQKHNLGIRKDETATRANMVMTAKFSLGDLEGGAEAYRSIAFATTSYNIVSSDYGTVSAERDARRRGVILLSDAITLRIAAYFNRLQTLKRKAK